MRAPILSMLVLAIFAIPFSTIARPVDSRTAIKVVRSFSGQKKMRPLTAPELRRIVAKRALKGVQTQAITGLPFFFEINKKQASKAVQWLAR